MAWWRTRYRAKVKWTRACVICVVSIANIDWIWKRWLNWQCTNGPLIAEGARAVIKVCASRRPPPLQSLAFSYSIADVSYHYRKEKPREKKSGSVSVSSYFQLHAKRVLADLAPHNSAINPCRNSEIVNRIKLISILFLFHFRTVVLIPITPSTVSRIQLQFTHSTRACLLFEW